MYVKSTQIIVYEYNNLVEEAKNGAIEIDANTGKAFFDFILI